MPRYRVTLAYNARAYRRAEFEAADDDDARNKALALDEWEPLDPDDNDFDEADVADRVLMLDEVNEDGSSQRDIEDEIRVSAEMPYGGAARRLVRGLAAQSLPRDAGPAAERLRNLIQQARALCGMTDEEVRCNG